MKRYKINYEIAGVQMECEVFALSHEQARTLLTESMSIKKVEEISDDDDGIFVSLLGKLVNSITNKKYGT